MRKINEYGQKLQYDFVVKTGMDSDIINGRFEGTLFYYNQIETINDAIGWMIETHGIDALDEVNFWIEEYQHTEAFGIPILEFKKELEKAFL